uniref:AlNc14C18G1854 protein n=1 Tax=Albugo laibachii Nc14 TaxID=890382 RepID=F0W4N3_9STRA|nr:AlNc14C18G1854 [Albugo laibachii Nc14]|eukprot:CCA16067.1 AlNc14C18G1854 [Albugo laibachii Nc14]
MRIDTRGKQKVSEAKRVLTSVHWHGDRILEKTSLRAPIPEWSTTSESAAAFSLKSAPIETTAAAPSTTDQMTTCTTLSYPSYRASSPGTAMLKNPPSLTPPASPAGSKVTVPSKNMENDAVHLRDGLGASGDRIAASTRL